jgi:hypothetical protein
MKWGGGGRGREARSKRWEERIKLESGIFPSSLWLLFARFPVDLFVHPSLIQFYSIYGGFLTNNV